MLCPYLSHKIFLGFICKIDKFPKLPEDVPAEYAKFFSEMRIDRKKRIFGFRVNSVYYIVWFDRDRSVCPE